MTNLDEIFKYLLNKNKSEIKYKLIYIIMI